MLAVDVSNLIPAFLFEKQHNSCGANENQTVAAPAQLFQPVCGGTNQLPKHRVLVPVDLFREGVRKGHCTDMAVQTEGLGHSDSCETSSLKAQEASSTPLYSFPTISDSLYLRRKTTPIRLPESDDEDIHSVAAVKCGSVLRPVAQRLKREGEAAGNGGSEAFTFQSFPERKDDQSVTQSKGGSGFHSNSPTPKICLSKP